MAPPAFWHVGSFFRDAGLGWLASGRPDHPDPDRTWLRRHPAIHPVRAAGERVGGHGAGEVPAGTDALAGTVHGNRYSDSVGHSRATRRCGSLASGSARDSGPHARLRACSDSLRLSGPATGWACGGQTGNWPGAAGESSRSAAPNSAKRSGVGRTGRELCSKNRKRTSEEVRKLLKMERETGLEPATSSLGSWHFREA